MTCKDCLYHERCHSEIAYGMGSDDLTGEYFTDIERRCAGFKNKADVVEVKHGEWQEIDNLVIEHGLPTVKGKTWRCSICGEARKNRTAPDMNYCPNCGAYMREEE